MSPNPLDQLRAYHLPEPVSWWPPAFGWWMLALLLIIGLSIGLWLFFRRHQSRTAQRMAQRSLRALVTEHRVDGNDLKLIRGLSRLLRRYALACYPRTEVAGLTGKAWLEFLDTHAQGDPFTRGAGRALAEAPYRPRAAFPVEELSGLVERWIERNPGADK